MANLLISLNAFFFLLYGLQCFLSRFMILEFERFGLSTLQRKATGTLQILGAAGLITGFFIPEIGLLAATGLSLMMLVAFLVRLKIRDGFFQSAPSLLFLVLNGWIAFTFYTLL